MTRLVSEQGGIDERYRRKAGDGGKVCWGPSTAGPQALGGAGARRPYLGTVRLTQAGRMILLSWFAFSRFVRMAGQSPVKNAPWAAVIGRAGPARRRRNYILRRRGALGRHAPRK